MHSFGFRLKIEVVTTIDAESFVDEEIAATKSTKSTISTKSTNSTNCFDDDQQKITLESNIADALPRSNVDKKVTDPNDSIENYVIIRFKTDYESDWHGTMRQFKEGEIVEIPAERAETWIKRGIVEEVSELQSDEPSNVESFEKIRVAAT